ncbi:MAG TPA: hypothetical protein VF837_04605 [Patescibacteria group bacterium]
MDESKFQSWCSAKSVPDGVSAELKKALSSLGAKGDGILDIIVNEDCSFAKAIRILSQQQVDIAPIITAYKKNIVQVTGSPAGVMSPAAPAEASHSEEQAEAPQPKAGRKFPGLGKIFGSKPKSQGVGPVVRPAKTGKKLNMRFVLIGIAVLIVVIAAGAFMTLGPGHSQSNSYVLPNDPASTATPQTVAPQVDANGNRIQWFSVKQDKLDSSQPFLVKPADFNDFINHLPWRWLLWLLFFIPMLSLLAQDRFASSERTDLKTVALSLGFLFACILFADPLANVFHWVSVQIGQPIDVPVFWVNLLGIAVNLSGQWAATQSGKKDYSAFAIGGLFITGALLIWWNPANLLVIIFGAAFMAAGIALEAHEMNRTHQGGSAVIVAILMLLVFAAAMGVWLLFCWAISFAPAPTAEWQIKVFGFVVWALVSSQYWMSGIVGLGVAYALGDMISSAIMSPRRPGSRMADNYPDQADREKRLDVNARFDAMVFSLMLLYPIAVLVWEAIRMFGAR